MNSKQVNTSESFDSWGTSTTSQTHPFSFALNEMDDMKKGRRKV